MLRYAIGQIEKKRPVSRADMSGWLGSIIKTLERGLAQEAEADASGDDDSAA